VFGTVPMNRLDNLVNYNTYNKLDGKINIKKINDEFEAVDDYLHRSANRRLGKL
jgi:hypothetical protein